MDFTEFNNLIAFIENVKENISEQYDNENIRLNETILDLTAICRDQKEKIDELQKKVDDNTFNENNYNKVSILRTLAKENDELKQQNAKLLASLNYRNCEVKKEIINNSTSIEVNEEVNEEENEEVNVSVEANVPVEANEEENEPVEANVPVESNEEEYVPVEANEEENEEELKVVLHKEKEYYVINNLVYRKKQNGDKGKKVGKLVNGKVKITKSKKK